MLSTWTSAFVRSVINEELHVLNHSKYQMFFCLSSAYNLINDLQCVCALPVIELNTLRYLQHLSVGRSVAKSVRNHYRSIIVVCSLATACRNTSKITIVHTTSEQSCLSIAIASIQAGGKLNGQHTVRFDWPVSTLTVALIRWPSAGGILLTGG